MNDIRTVLITGANAGLGFEASKQLARQNGIEKIYLGCRNLKKATEAKEQLVTETGKDIFEILILDVSSAESVKVAVANLSTPIDAVVLNAGGMGGKTPNKLTKEGVTTIFASNLLGHVVLINELLKRQLITSTVLYAGSEAARGIPKMGVEKPNLKDNTVDEFVAIANGHKFGPSADPLNVYGTIKLTGALWMSAMSRKHPHIRFITMSPGGTTGTNGMDDLPLAKKIFFKYIGGLVMPKLGMMHSVETGAKRYIEGLLNTGYESGRFYASKKGAPTGNVVDQITIDRIFANESAQNAAWQAVQLFAR